MKFEIMLNVLGLVAGCFLLGWNMGWQAGVGIGMVALAIAPDKNFY